MTELELVVPVEPKKRPWWKKVLRFVLNVLKKAEDAGVLDSKVNDGGFQK